TSGTYRLGLTTISEQGCDAASEQTIEIFPAPSTNFTHTPACDDVVVTLASQVDNAADWYWEIGTSYYETREVQHTFRSPGSYEVYLQVTGMNGGYSACHATIAVPEPLSPDFSVAGHCAGHEAVFTNITSGDDPVIESEWF